MRGFPLGICDLGRHPWSVLPSLLLSTNQLPARRVNLPVGSLYDALLYRVGTWISTDFHRSGQVRRGNLRKCAGEGTDMGHAPGNQWKSSSLCWLAQKCGSTNVLGWWVWKCVEICGNLWKPVENKCGEARKFLHWPEIREL